MMSYTIYIVDDEAVARNGLKLALKKKNYKVQAFESAESALKAIDENPPDLVLLDIGLPGMSGVEALEVIKKHHPEVIIVMITAYEDVQTVVSSMKNGAYEYVVKPVRWTPCWSFYEMPLKPLPCVRRSRPFMQNTLKKICPALSAKAMPFRISWSWSLKSPRARIHPF